MDFYIIWAIFPLIAITQSDEVSQQWNSAICNVFCMDRKWASTLQMSPEPKFAPPLLLTYGKTFYFICHYNTLQLKAGNGN